MKREVSHFDTLRELLEVERREADAQFTAKKLGKSSAELVALGLALDDLMATDEALGLGGRILLTFERENKAEIDGDFDVGGIVEVSTRRGEDARPLRGVISKRRRRELTISFDMPPPDPIKNGRVWLEAGADATTFERASRALATVRAWERGGDRARRDLLLGHGAPRERPRKPVPSTLNPEQQEAVRRGLATEDFLLVHGPPGTGKSTVLTEIGQKLVADGRRVLLTAASNAAVDHLLASMLAAGVSCVRIGHPARVAEHLAEHTLDGWLSREPEYELARELYDEALALKGYARRQRTQGRSAARFQNAREAGREAKDLLHEAREREKKAVRAILARVPVVASTLAGLYGSVMAEEHFDVALFDEATQAIEPMSLAAFVRADTVILAGDHKQLPPTVVSPRAAREGLSKSLFERLLEDHGEGSRVMLREQHRMHEVLMRFPSDEMYGGELRAHPRAATRRLPIASAVLPLLLVDTAGRGFEEERPEGQESLRNLGEAEIVLMRAQQLVELGLGAADMAIISPYKAQVQHLRELASAHPGLTDVEIDTVDAFQGREKEAVLISLVRTNEAQEIGFLSDVRRMNVAITRAKSHLFIVGDSATIGGHPFYQRLLDYAQSVGGYVSIWEWQPVS